MRRELRIKHGDWTRKIQEAADKGRIGGILRKIIGEEKDFSLEVLYRDGGTVTDADEIAGEVTRVFGEEWFFQTDEERKKGVDLRRAMRGASAAEFLKISEAIKVPAEVALMVREGLLRDNLGRVVTPFDLFSMAAGAKTSPVP